MSRMRRLVAALCVCLLFVGSTSPVEADRWFAPPPVLGIVDAGREASAARQAGASWDRALFLWQSIQPNGPTDWNLDSYLDQNRLKPTLTAALPVVGGGPGP